MSFKSWLLLAAILTLGSHGGAENATLEEGLKTLIGKTAEAQQNIHVKWWVDRTIYPNPRSFQIMLATVKQEMEGAKTDSERQNALVQQEAIKEASEESRFWMKLDLNLVDLAKFEMRQSFYASNPPIDHRYVSNANGLLYRVQPSTHEIEMTRNATVALAHLAAGLPSLLAREIVQKASAVALMPAESGFRRLRCFADTAHVYTDVVWSDAMRNVVDVISYKNDKVAAEIRTERGDLKPGKLAPVQLKLFTDGVLAQDDRWYPTVQEDNVPPNTVNTEYKLEPGYVFLDKTLGVSKAVQTNDMLRDMHTVPRLPISPDN